MRRILCLLAPALLIAAAPGASTGQLQTAPPMCLDVQPETPSATTGSPVFLVLTLRQKVAASASCDGRRAETGDSVVHVDVEMSGSNDPDAADTPDAPDARCEINPSHSIEARCTIAVWGDETGAQTIRAWIDGDGAEPPRGVTEADRDEGPDDRDEPGTGCIGSVPDPAAPEPDCTDVAEIEWTAQPRCYDPESPGGRFGRIAAGRRGEGVKTGTYTIGPASGDLRLVRRSDSLYRARWSPDHRHLSYATGSLNGSHLWAIRADGTNAVQLTRNKRLDEGAAWSPDSRHVVYSSYDYFAHEPAQLYVVGADGRGTKQLTRGPAPSNDPDWSPDGRSIVFARSNADGRTTGLFEIGSRGGRVRKLVSGRAAFQRPQYSPNGRRILFLRNSSLFVTRAGGRDTTRLTPPRRRIADFHWSPDGSKVVYATSSPAGWNEVRVVRTDGSRDRRIVRHFGADELSPSWSPDSSHVAYQLPYQAYGDDSVTQSSDVWISAADGSCQEALTTTPDVYDGEPSWTTPAST